MSKVGFVYDDIFLKHEPPRIHPEAKERLQHIVSDLKRSGLWEELHHIRPRKAGLADISLVHTVAYIEKVQHLSSGYLDPDTYVSKDSFEVALYAVGAVLEAIDHCQREDILRAFCAVRPPGHHAEADRGMGFCIFNNIAVGARYAQKIGYQKVFIIDFDVHHGNGTQHIFEQDDSVFYFSTHQYPHYPGTGNEHERGRGKGEGFTYNVAMSAGSGDKEYLYVYQDILPGLLKRFRPDIVLVSAGYDIHARDPLSSIRISSEGISGIVRSIISDATRPVIFALEGGYDLEALGASVRITIEEMLLI
ncbi:MAG: histone deacetylase [Dissulfurispiraceae bacterium]